MVLAEEQQEVGQFRVRERVTVSEQDVPQLAARGQQLPQTAHALVALGKRPAYMPLGRWLPAGQKLAPPLAQFAQYLRKQGSCPGKRTFHPAPDLARRDVGRVAAQQGRQGGQRQPLDHKPADHRQNLAEAGGFVGHVGAGTEAWKAQPRDGQLLDVERMRRIARRAAAPAIPKKRPKGSVEGGADDPKPREVIRVR